MSQVRPDYEVLAVIPARGGSKGIVRKNLRKVGGVPLVSRAVQACLGCGAANRVVVSTDDLEIAQTAELAGAEVVARPSELAQDDNSSESAVVHALAATGFASRERGVILLVQCTSPFLAVEDLARAAVLVGERVADSAFSACLDHGFYWRDGGTGVEAINHDSARRVRRQDLQPQWRETGGFYAMSLEGFNLAQHRFFGKKAVVEVSPRFAIDVDVEEDLLLAEALVPHWIRATGAWPGLGEIDLLVTDFDGVHTDDRVWVDQDGREAVLVNRRDGLAIRQLQSAGLPVLVLSTETNPVVEARTRKLGVECIAGSSDKASDLCEWVARRGIDLRRVAFVGNDVNDVGVMSLVGWPIAVADASRDVLSLVRLVTTCGGGTGVLREIADRLLSSSK